MKKKFKKTDAAVVFHEDGSVEIEIPKIDPVPDYVMLCTALAILVTKNDKQLLRVVNRQIKEFSKMAREEEKKIR